MGSRPLGPKRLGKYELIARIGKGGMAQVYLARQRGPANFEKVVVVKSIHPHLAAKKSFIDMLLDEARIAALLKHPCVVDIYDLGLDDETYFIAMEYLSGEPMLSVLRAGRVAGRALDVHSTARIIADVADGLHAAHELRDNAGNHMELVHRDVTPGNIVVLYSGQVKIVDFGIAKARGRLANETDARKLKGKLGYVAPEQVRGQTADRRADVFALGVVMWEALTYRRLFRGTKPATVLSAIVKQKLEPPSSVRSEVPAALDAICMKALARDPDSRYATAHDMHAALESFLAEAGQSLQRQVIAGYMSEVFAEQISERARLLREMPEASDDVGVKDATAAFAPVADGGDEDDGDTPVDGFDARPGLAAAAGTGVGQGAGNGASAAVQVVSLSPPPAGAAPLPPTTVSASRASSNLPGSSGELAAPYRRDALAPLPAEQSRRRRVLIATVGIGCFILLLAVTAMLDSRPNPQGDELQAGADVERARAAAAGSGAETEPAPPSAAAAAEGLALPSSGDADGDSDADADADADAVAAAQAEEAGAAEPAASALAVEDGDGDSEAAAADATAADATAAANSPDPQRQAAARLAATRAVRERARALHLEGASLFIRGDHAAAQRKFRESLALAPRYAPAYRGLGMAYQAAGNNKQAAQAFRQYLRLAPKAGDRADITARLQEVSP
ncbi:serine/threonine-protein kinase [Haliangium ochraceum]|uniref:Serine/threonine protein kinase with TPR repeats n=1 Tax=Haliangium ochraceum (strain DSM 14365 / JCM 11303 / SMP-2) TaxID=502025 RepID=D0LJ76_HALO1|nr:serine/threonine-protein kinase [Haliangium ochraceum]ACY14923.1 serine/threonine protein kinase with TPR repeats [Haliangium ochraceum DSM 14365]